MSINKHLEFKDKGYNIEPNIEETNPNKTIIWSDGISVDIGETIKQNTLIKYNLSVTKLADMLGLTRATLYNIFSNKHKLTPNVGIRLNKVFGINHIELLEYQLKNELDFENKYSDFGDLKRYENE